MQQSEPRKTKLLIVKVEECSAACDFWARLGGNNYCMHPALGSEAHDRQLLNGSNEPPDWCPLRSEAVLYVLGSADGVLEGELESLRAEINIYARAWQERDATVAEYNRQLKHKENELLGTRALLEKCSTQLKATDRKLAERSREWLKLSAKASLAQGWQPHRSEPTERAPAAEPASAQLHEQLTRAQERATALLVGKRHVEALLSACEAHLNKTQRDLWSTEAELRGRQLRSRLREKSERTPTEERTEPIKKEGDADGGKHI